MQVDVPEPPISIRHLSKTLTLTSTSLTLSICGQTPSTHSHPLSSIAFIAHDLPNHQLKIVWLSTHPLLSHPLTNQAHFDLPPHSTQDEPHITFLTHPIIKSLLIPHSNDESNGKRRLEIILNPTAGAGSASNYFETTVEPLLIWAGVSYHLSVTTAPGDAKGIAVDILGRAEQQTRLEAANGGGETTGGATRRTTTVMLLGGDGTTHEFINGLLTSPPSTRPEIDIILLPLGTANALYYHSFPPERGYDTDSPAALLYSLLAYLRAGQGARKGLDLARNDLLPSPSTPSSSAGPIPTFDQLSLSSSSPSTSLPPSETSPIYTTVVTSFALHASILHTAESLRSSHPGLERFKLAAHQNASRWTTGVLRLSGGSSGVGIYDLESKSWRAQGGSVVLRGPFSYLTAALIDRFEPTFLIAPFRSSHSLLPPPASSPTSTSTDSPPSIDIVIIRPMRDAKTSELFHGGKEKEAKEGFTEWVWKGLMGAYQSGAHVDVKYDGEEGRSVVEYYRCEGFEWEPVRFALWTLSCFRWKVATYSFSLSPQTESEDPMNGLVCLDGALGMIGVGGKVRTQALGSATTGVSVWSGMK
ncbi:hypothetical protein P7C70_g5104, partial [Phenoliferia sp. Uapishka_3]